MLAEFCPVYGEFCRTAHADIHIPAERHLTVKEILMTQNVMDASRSTLVPLAHVIEHLREASRVLEGCKTHPGETTLIGLTADQVKSLELVLARTNRKQRDFIDGDLVAAAEAEAIACRSELARLKPFITEAKCGHLSAESLMAVLNAGPDPRVARERFLSLEGKPVTVRDAQQIFLSPNAQPLPKQYAAQESYTLNVQVENTDMPSFEARLLLVDKLLPSPLFSRTDVGNRCVTARVPDAEDLLCIGLCMLLGVHVSVELAITVGIGHAGLTYRATLIRLTDPNVTNALLTKTMADRARTLL